MPIPFAVTLPYKLHTNRELGLMLAGSKPLAHFVDGVDMFPDVVLRYLRRFDRHVVDGRIVRVDHISRPIRRSPWRLHRILFAVPSERWRVAEMIALQEEEVWSEAHERREGELLGYEDWMNDYHLARPAQSVGARS